MRISKIFAKISYYVANAFVSFFWNLAIFFSNSSLGSEKLNQNRHFDCRPWFLSPATWQCNALSGNRSPSIFVTWLNRVSRRFLIFWTSASFCWNILRTVSFLIPSLLVTDNNLLNQAISALRIIRSFFQTPTFWSIYQHRYYKGFIQSHFNSLWDVVRLPYSTQFVYHRWC